ncbi:MAG: hypothetical protein GY699_06425 [Desulfobacteraceae bacterium]|nr:hypothetical protein [Desulfobacteraceae bacterium]
MKNIILYFTISIILLFHTGCIKNNKQDLISAINNKYYNLSDEGLKTLNVKIVDKKLAQANKEISRILGFNPSECHSYEDRILSQIGKNDQFSLKVLDFCHFGIEKLDKKGKEATEASLNLIGIHLNIWRESIFNPILPDPLSNYDIIHAEDNKVVKIIDKENNMAVMFNKNLKMINIGDIDSQLANWAKPTFVKTGNKYLLKKYQVYEFRNSVETVVSIGYKKIEGFMLPSNIGIKILKDGKEDIRNYTFSDYKINKREEKAVP